VRELEIPLDQPPDFRLDGKTALVTGAGRGIGASLAHALATAGAQVAVAARTRIELTHVADQIGDAGGDALAVEMDLRDIESIESAIAATVAHYGKLDVLVNNAGVGTNHDALDLDPTDWDDLMAVNLRGLFFACQAAGRHMIARGSGRIINISSQAGQVGIVRHAAYCASKGGVEQLTRVLALEWGPHGVTVNAVAPTFIRTPGTAERLDDPDFLAEVLRRIPTGRVGSPMDVAGPVVFLASAAAALVNGAVLTVDGGWTAQ
jgi:NAD(P)-dependent dehydrogenase (short-subunit alcohol dehydrogenase family)